jgi:hypothetical protein
MALGGWIMNGVQAHLTADANSTIMCMYDFPL